MRRFFSILEGPGKGTEKPLDKEYMLVGRSHVADVQIEGDDLLVSRRHLEVRIKDGEVFVKDISSKGSMLNGQRLKGEVSLNPGDVLDLGGSKLQYEELEAEAPPSDQTQSRPAPPVLDDRTRVADDRTRAAGDRTRLPDDRTRLAGQGTGAQRAQDEAASGEATHAVVEDQTRMLNPVELPGWKSPTQRRAGARLVLTLAVLTTIALVAGGTYWLLKDDSASANGAGIEYKDTALGFAVRFPPEWSRMAGKANRAELGTGKEDSGEWARVHIYPDKNAQYSITGLKSGFAEYKETLKNQFKDGEVTGSQRRTVNGVQVVFFGFTGSDVEGVGIYTLNADTRVVVECFNPRKNNQRYASAFDSIFKSFHFISDESQQCIDFPLPDATMKRMALSSPAELAREVQEHNQRAEALVASKDVRPDNLYRAVREYGQALQLAVAGPQPLPSYPALAHGLQQATQLYGQAVDRQLFEVNRALKAKDSTTAYWAATRLMQMVPDKTSPTHLEAYKIFRALDPAK